MKTAFLPSPFSARIWPPSPDVKAATPARPSAFESTARPVPVSGAVPRLATRFFVAALETVRIPPFSFPYASASFCPSAPMIAK